VIKDWWRVALREIPNGLALGAMLGLVGIVRISLWQSGPLRLWRALDPDRVDGRPRPGRHRHVRLADRIQLPFIPQRIGFDPASASAPFVATLVDVTGMAIYFTVASMILRETLL
jgi:magnesium transporter